MRSILAFLILPLALNAAPIDYLQREARDSIKTYFENSNRQLKSLRWVDLSLLNRENQEYLVEAEVIAQMLPFSQNFARYHCGVFTKRLTVNDWQVNLTACEAFSEFAPLP